MTIPLNPQPAMPGPAFQGLPLDTACAQAAAFANVIRETESVALAQAVGRCLAQDVVARRACPDRDLSAMDGYAVATACNLGAGTHLKIEGRIAAGDVAESLADGTAARIFTGAAIPAGAGAVVMQEHAKRDGAFVILERPVAMGENIRRRAEDVAPGDLLLREGQRLNARGVAIVAAQGIDRLWCAGPSVSRSSRREMSFAMPRETASRRPAPSTRTDPCCWRWRPHRASPRPTQAACPTIPQPWPITCGASPSAATSS